LPELTCKQRESDDPWRGIQPRYEAIVMRGERHFELRTKLPSGEPVAVRLGPLPPGAEPRSVPI
jgi:hypothetical protein